MATADTRIAGRVVAKGIRGVSGRYTHWVSITVHHLNEGHAAFCAGARQKLSVPENRFDI